jgi:hypothetical protein
VRLLADVLGAFEHHVFEQVSKARAARPLIQRTDVVPEIDSHERQPVIFVRDARSGRWAACTSRIESGAIFAQLRFLAHFAKVQRQQNLPKA